MTSVCCSTLTSSSLISCIAPFCFFNRSFIFCISSATRCFACVIEVNVLLSFSAQFFSSLEQRIKKDQTIIKNKKIAFHICSNTLGRDYTKVFTEQVNEENEREYKFLCALFNKKLLTGEKGIPETSCQVWERSYDRFLKNAPNTRRNERTNGHGSIYRTNLQSRWVQK